MQFSKITFSLLGFFSSGSAFAPIAIPSRGLCTACYARDGNKGSPSSLLDDAETKAKAGQSRAEMDISKVQDKLENKMDEVAEDVKDAVDDLETKAKAGESRAEMDIKKVRKGIDETAEDLEAKAKAGQSRAEMDIKKTQEGDDFNN